MSAPTRQGNRPRAGSVAPGLCLNGAGHRRRSRRSGGSDQERRLGVHGIRGGLDGGIGIGGTQGGYGGAHRRGEAGNGVVQILECGHKITSCSFLLVTAPAVQKALEDRIKTGAHALAARQLSTLPTINSPQSVRPLGRMWPRLAAQPQVILCRGNRKHQALSRPVQRHIHRVRLHRWLHPPVGVDQRLLSHPHQFQRRLHFHRQEMPTRLPTPIPRKNAAPDAGLV